MENWKNRKTGNGRNIKKMMQVLKSKERKKERRKIDTGKKESSSINLLKNFPAFSFAFAELLGED